MTLAQPRPVRDNNPGDLDAGEPWQGLMPSAQMNAAQRAEPRFCVFLNPAWGFRALAIVLRNYGRLYGDRTVRTIIARFAPSVENNTLAYTSNVCKGMGVGPDAVLDLADTQTLLGLCRAIATQEAGGWFFATADLEQGVSWALAQGAQVRVTETANENAFVGKRHLFAALNFNLTSRRLSMLIHDPQTLKLGKKAPVQDPRTLKFASYLKASTVPQAPASCDWTKAVAGNWPAMLNNDLGDCTCAAAGHMIELWTANSGQLVIPSDADILAAYEFVGGYKPADPADPQSNDTDGGAIELDVLKYWKTTGIAGRTIDGFVSVMPHKLSNVKEAVFLFGALYAGVALPITAQSQDVWDVLDHPDPDAAPGSWGGHAIPIVAYDADGLTCVTWGALKRMTWAWWHKYADEAYAVLSKDWAKPTNVAPDRFNYSQLAADLAALR